MRISLEEAVQQLTSGHVVAVPTETVYGLAALLQDPAAIEQVFILKGRPFANPLIIHVASYKGLVPYVSHFPPHFEDLAQMCWPGPFTCILPVRSTVPSIVRAGLDTAGFRIPGLPITRELIQATGPLVMPSANLSGRPSATSPRHVEEDFGRNFPVMDGGECRMGLESTILLYQESEWVIVRLGAIPSTFFQSILGYEPRFVKQSSDHQPLCPGQAFRHYAPNAHLFVHELPLAVKNIVGFTERNYPVDRRVFILGSLHKPEQVAENLYKVLRQLDQENVQEAWVDMDFPKEGLWLTIAERLLRACDR